MLKKREKVLFPKLTAAGFAALLIGVMCMLSGCIEKRTEDGYRYVVSGAYAVITGYDGESPMMDVPFAVDIYPVNRIAKGAIPEKAVGLSLPDGITVEEGAFTNASALRYLFLGEDISITSAPVQCDIYRAGDQAGSGSLVGIDVDASGVLYGLLDDMISAVVLRIPEDTTEYEVPTALESAFIVTGFDSGCLDDADSLTSLTLGYDNYFEPEMLEAFQGLDEFSYPENSVTHNYIRTIEIADILNAQRDAINMVRIVPDIEIVRAACERVEELQMDYSFNRPDGREGYTVLEDAEVQYNLSIEYTHRDNDMDAICNSMGTYLAENQANPSSGICYERIGAAAAINLSEENSYPYVMSCFLTNHSVTSVINGSVQYELQNDMMIPVAFVEDAKSVWLYPSICGKKAGEISVDLLAAAPELHGIVLSEKYSYDLEIPEQYAVVRLGEDTGDGKATGIYIDSKNQVYAKTDRDRYVLWDIPDDMEDCVLSSKIGDLPVTYIRTEAVTGSPNLKSIYMSDVCGFDPMALSDFQRCKIYVYGYESLEQLTEATELIKSMYFSIQTSVMLADAVNEIHGDSGVTIQPTCDMVRAARQLASEQPEKFGTERPDGSAWSTVFDEQFIEGWENGGISVKKLVEKESIQDLGITDISQNFAEEKDGGYYYSKTALGAWAEGETVYVCGLGSKN